MTVKRSFGLGVVWNSCINNNVLPFTIFEELENCKTILNTIVDDQVVQKLWVGALNQEWSEEPAVTKNTLLDISWVHWVSVHFWFLVFWNNFLRSLPFNRSHIQRVLRWVNWIDVQRWVVSWEFRITKKCIVLRADGDNLLNLILNRILLWLLLLHILLLSHHLFSILLTHLISIFLLLLKHLLVHFLTDWLAIFINILVRVILSHHLLLL